MLRFLIRFSCKELWNHKRRSLTLFVVLFLTYFLLAESMFLYHAYRNMQIQDAYDNTGYYHIHAIKTEKGQGQKLLKDDAVKRAGLCSESFDADIQEAKPAEKGSDIVFQYMDQTALELMHPKLRYGRLPEKKGEVLVSACLKKNGEYLYNSLPQGEDAEIRVKTESLYQTFMVVGVLNDLDAGGNSECRIKAFTDKVAEPGEYYIETAKADRTSIRKYLIRAGYDYGTEVYDTMELKKTGGNYSGNYDVELNNRVLDVLVGVTPDGSVSARLLLIVAASFVLFTGALMLCATISIGLEERIRENGLLRVIGFSPEMYVFYHLLESGLLITGVLLFAVPATVFCAGRVVSFAGKLRFSPLSAIQMQIDVPGMAVSAVMLCLLAFFCTIIPVLRSLRESVCLMLKKGHSVKMQGRLERREGRREKFSELKMGVRQTLRRPGRTISVVLSMATVFTLLIVYIICMNIIKERQEQQGELHKGEFTFFGDGSADALAALKEIPYHVSWHEVVKDEFAEYKNSGIKLNPEVEDKVSEWVEFWGGEYVHIETMGISEGFYEKFLRPAEGNMMPDYETLVQEKAAVIDDRVLLSSGRITNVLNLHFPASLPRSEKEQELKLRARVVDTKGNIQLRENGAPIIYVPEEIFKEYFEPGYTLAYFNIDDSQVYEFQEWAIENEAELSMVLTDHVSEYLAERDTKSMLQGILLAALLLIGCISFLNLINSFYANARMQRKDYAIMSALGMPAGQMYLVVAGEAIVYVLGAVFLSAVFIMVGMRWLLSLLLSVKLKINAYLFFLLGITGAASFFLCFLIGLLCSYKNRNQPVAAVLCESGE